MEPTNSLFSSNTFQSNLDAIIFFPDPDQVSGACIKDSYGSLIRNDGFISKAYHYYSGGSFKATEQLIEKTINLYLEILNSDLIEIFHSTSEPEKLVNNGNTLINILKYREDVHFALKLQKGSENIEKAIKQKWGQESNHEGIKEISEFNINFKEELTDHLAQLNAKISSLVHNSEIFNALIQDEKSINAEKATCDLESFCKIHCPGIGLTEAIEFIKKGQQLIVKIQEGDCHPSIDSTESQDELTGISWYLTFRSILKGQGHFEGAFMIEDNEEKLYTFLCKSPGYSAGLRKSSHLMGRTPKHIGTSSYVVTAASHHGVDVVNQKLPSQKRTILFELAENAPFLKDVMPSKVLFLKLENYSPFLTTGKGYDALYHSSEWGVSVLNKTMYPGSDDLPTMRKERVPSDLIKNFAKLVDHVQANLSQLGGEDAFKSGSVEEQQLINLNEAKSNSKLWGIAYMYHFLTKINTMVGSEDVVFNALKDSLMTEIKLLDHYDRRTGREVYLTSHELSI